MHPNCYNNILFVYFRWTITRREDVGSAPRTMFCNSYVSASEGVLLAEMIPEPPGRCVTLTQSYYTTTAFDLAMGADCHVLCNITTNA